MPLRTNLFIILALAALMVILTPPVAKAGPPLICHPIDIGDAKSLPWTDDTFTPDKGYDLKRLVGDTIDLLSTDMPVLVRMETLRRATLYIDHDRSRADALLGRLMARALDRESTGDQSALAWFDAGYLAQCFHQTNTETSFGPAISKGVGASAIAGYAWVGKAIASDPANTQMHLAAALMTVDSRVPEYDNHMRQALAGGGTPHSPAAESLLGWIATISGTTPDALRAKFATADARSGR